ncbi:MAG: GDP-mannose 4,6-dehydratase [Candidatus Rokubacteria bacterium]|nr:GDP-mannose 4,6-dehydratase [Candidatus Rokubacteria bacterium]
MRILITGVTGFVGSHLADLAVAAGADVYGASRWRSATENVAHLRDRLHLVECDVRDPSSVQRLLDIARPDWIAHLAGQSSVGASWTTPAETFHTNVLSQVHVLEAVRARPGPPPRVLVVGSSEEYGLVRDGELPVTEDNALRPVSPYAVSKVAQDLMGFQYFRSYGLPIVRSRAFNHDGPRRPDVFVTGSFARQIVAIERGERPPVIEVGNLQARRDYTDVRDIVRGYWQLLERGEPGEVYNLCSGAAWSIEDILQRLLSLSRVEGIAVKEDPARLRPADIPLLVGSAARMERATGWRPTIPFEQTLADVLDYWRSRVTAG